MKKAEKKKTYSVSFNENRQVWIGRYKDALGKWQQKYLPRELGADKDLEAEQWMIGFVLNQKFVITSPDGSQGQKKTIRALSDKWLELRKRDQGTKINTWRGFRTSIRTWILDNPEFPHVSIENLDIETELTEPMVRAWIDSLVGIKYASRIAHVRCLNAMLEDCASEGWVDRNYVSPFLRKPIKKVVRNLFKMRKKTKTIITVPNEAWQEMLSRKLHKIDDIRKIRYIVALCTGLRDHEIQGLIWSDINLSAPIPFLSVKRQLDKIGNGMVFYEDLVMRGLSKDQIAKHPSAIVSNPKYDSKREIPLHPLLVEALKFWRNAWFRHVGRTPQESDPVFARSRTSIREGEPGNFCFIDSAALLRKDLERASHAVPDVTFHSLRRTFASCLEDSGLEKYKIDALLGHAAESTSDGHYIQKNMKSFYEAICRLPMPSQVELSRTTLTWKT